MVWPSQARVNDEDNHRYKRQSPTMPTVTAQFILPDMDHFGGCGQSDTHRAGSPGTVGDFGESLLIGKGRSNAESIGNKGEGLLLEESC
jgi:hypothetical protein